MAKITRYNGNLKAFGSEAIGLERTVYGDVTQSDILDDNINIDFLRGWGIVGINENPTKQDFNGVAFTLGQLIAYLHQVGVPEWDAAQEYFDGSVVTTETGIFILKTGGDGSINPASDNGTNWEKANVNDFRYSPTFSTISDMQAAIPLSIDGKAVSLLAGMRILTKEHSVGFLGGGVYEVETGDTSDSYSRILLSNGNTAVLQCISSRVDGSQFGITGTGDEFGKIQAAIKFAYDNQATDLVFPTNTQVSISSAIFWNSYGVLTNSQNIWNLNVLLTAETAGGAVVNVGRGADVGNADAIERTGRVIFHNPRIDGASIAGENGFGIARAEDVIILNPEIKNCKRDYVGTREGGRAITVHDRCKNITVINHKAINCSDAFHIGHLPDYSSSDSGNTVITSITLGNPTTLTLVNNTFAIGEFVTTYNIGGTVELNPSYSFLPQYEVLSSVGSVITIDVDSTAFGAFTSGGNCVRADLTGGGRSPAVALVGMYAENCEYSLINIEASNQPRSISPYQTCFASNIVGKNCGGTLTRGLINGNNAIGLQINGLVAYNDDLHPLTSIIRGSFQGSVIRGVYDIHTLTKSVIDASPTSENPAGSGIDAGISSFPYGTSLDNEYDLSVIIRGDHAEIDSLINVTDSAGSSIDDFYRNRVNISIGGLDGNDGYTGLINNVALHYSNWINVSDTSIGTSTEGSFSSGSLSSSKISASKENIDNIHIKSSSTASIKALNANGDIKGRIDYTITDDRYRMYLGNVQAYQFTINNILPNVDNLKDLGSPGLRMRTIYAGTGTINTSDFREKEHERPINDIERSVALALKSKIKAFKFKDAVQLKGSSARIHFGVMAQEIKEIFSDHGLNAHEYGLFCYDEWIDEFDLEGNKTVNSGNRYGVRYDELMAFIISSM